MTRCENCGLVALHAPEVCSSCGAFCSHIPAEDLPVQPTPTMLAVHARDIEDGESRFIPTGFEPWDEVLGGGLVPGSSLVLYGEAGSRKTTWAGAIANEVARRRRSCALYLSPEMQGPMVRDTISRVVVPSCLYVVGSERNASNLDACLKEVSRLRPSVVVYDSIQGFDTSMLTSLAGSDMAVKATVLIARRFAAMLRHTAILISQVNKSGLPAGPQRTIHDCDIVAHVCFAKVTIRNKNRFAPTPREAALP